MKYLLIIIMLSFFTNLLGRNFNCIVKTYSENEEYVVVSKPYSARGYIGCTEVIRLSDSISIYSINKYFKQDFIFLSNDGNSFVTISRGGIMDFYENGEKRTEFDVAKIANDINPNCDFTPFFERLIWRERIVNPQNIEKENIGYQQPIFVHDDSLFVILCTDSIFGFDLKGENYVCYGNLYDDTIDADFLENKTRTININIDFKSLNTLPLMKNQETVYDSLANYINMAFDSIPQTGRYKYYYLSVNCLINSDGKCEEVTPRFKFDSKKDSISAFFKDVVFDMEKLPNELEKWNYYDRIPFRSIDPSFAKYELERDQQEMKERDRPR